MSNFAKIQQFQQRVPVSFKFYHLFFSVHVQIRRTVFLTNQTNALNCSETIN